MCKLIKYNEQIFGLHDGTEWYCGPFGYVVKLKKEIAVCFVERIGFGALAQNTFPRRFRSICLW